MGKLDYMYTFDNHALEKHCERKLETGTHIKSWCKEVRVSLRALELNIDEADSLGNSWSFRVWSKLDSTWKSLRCIKAPRWFALSGFRVCQDSVRVGARSPFITASTALLPRVPLNHRKGIRIVPNKTPLNVSR